MPAGGWLKAAREAGEYSQQHLAGKLGTKRQAWAQLERSEARGAISLHSLRRAADAMGYDLVYYLIPRELEDAAEGRADAIAVVPKSPDIETGAREEKSAAGAVPAWSDGELPTELR